MAKPTPLSGFPELLPEQRIVEQQVIDTLRHTFELHGFAGIETRAVEPLDQLLRKGETSKEVYLLRRLHEESREGHAGIGLHFDLTVPFARYVLENAGKLEFPFRRYQIQKAWRGERPQEGRFREFTQADIDVVGRDELPFHHDVEVARVMVDALTRLADSRWLGLPGFRLQVNNRKLIQGFYARPRARRHRRGHAGRRQARQGAGRQGPRHAGRRGGPRRRDRRPGAVAGHDPRHRRLLRRGGARPRRRARAARRGPRPSSPQWCDGCADLVGDRVRVEADLRSPAGWTTTPARCSRRGWTATSRWARSAPAAATTRSPPTGARRTPASASRSASAGSSYR